MPVRQCRSQKHSELLTKGAISKSDFKGDANTILADGSIANNAVFFVVKELNIADQAIMDVEFKVNHKLRQPLMLGRLTLSKIGNFKIDQKKKEIVFLKINRQGKISLEA